MILIGLGNPGSVYQQSRHNAGWMVIDHLTGLLQLPWKNHADLQAQVAQGNFAAKKVFCIKSQSYMNESGAAVRKVIEFFKLEDLQRKDQSLSEVLVIHDDLDLVIGKYKIQFGRGPKEHNGLSSIYQHLGTTKLWHVRIGIDGREGTRSVPSSVYVLQQFTENEAAELQSVVAEVTAKLVDLVHASKSDASAPASASI